MSMIFVAKQVICTQRKKPFFVLVRANTRCKLMKLKEIKKMQNMSHLLLCHNWQSIVKLICQLDMAAQLAVKQLKHLSNFVPSCFFG